MNKHGLTRRSFVAAASAAVAGAAIARGKDARPLTVAQIVDTSQAQQDVSKDFLIGSRAAWQDINARGGVRGRQVTHKSIEVDGSDASLRAALDTVRDTPDCMVLSGTAGDRLATSVMGLLQKSDLQIAHVAPWLQNSSVPVDASTFPIFAGRQEQIVHAVKSLASVGFSDVAAVYATETDWQTYRDELERAAGTLKLRLQTIRAKGDFARAGATLPQAAPAVLLFIGGTPELIPFVQGLEKQQRLRYVIAMADVNLQVVAQLGAARRTAVIATQPVPEVGAGLPIVRSYRDTLARLFDETPTALSLAGFIAARYTYEVMADVDAPSRARVLAAFRQRQQQDLGGFRIAFDDNRRSVSYVTQSMLTQDGRIIG